MATRKVKRPALYFPTPVATLSMTFNLEEPINTRLTKYQDFIEKTNGVRPSIDDIINRALDRVFSRDAAFKEFHGSKTRGRGAQGRASENDPPREPPA